jgi:hypothetical protein
VRKFLFTPVAAVLLAGLASGASGEDVAKIVDQYVKAAGGTKNIARIQTLTIEGKLTASNDRAGTFTFDTRQPNRYYSELVLGDKSWIEAYSGKSAWHQNGAEEIATFLGEESEQLESAAQYYNTRLLNFKKNKLALALIGHAQVRGKDTWQIEVTAQSGTKRQVYIDTATHLIAEENAMVGGVEETMFYGDYRTVNGVKLPYEIELRRGSDVYQIRVTRAEINGALPEHVFDFPKKSQVQLPDLEALFKKIDENQKAIDKIKENYAGTRVEEETEFDGNGKVKKVETNQYSFWRRTASRWARKSSKKRTTRPGNESNSCKSTKRRKKPGKKKLKNKARTRKKTTPESKSFCELAALRIRAASAFAARMCWSLISSLILNFSRTSWKRSW